MNLFRASLRYMLAITAVVWLCGSVAWAQPQGKCTGTIDHSTWHKDQRGTCSVNVLPKTVQEFKALQAQVGVEPQGAVLCFAAAMNIYVQNAEAGMKCLEMASYKLSSDEKSQLKQKLRGSDFSCQPYLPMAAFKGASPENGYTPTKPYTVEVTVNNAVKYSLLNDAISPVISLLYKTKGTDMGMRVVSVIKPDNSDYFLVYDRGGMMLQVRPAVPKSKGK